jgi:hypothetical protein
MSTPTQRDDRLGRGGSMSELALVVRAVNRQAVLMRVMLTAHRLGVAVITASVDAGVPENELADVELSISGDAAAVRRFVARLGRAIDVASVRAQERPRLDVSVPQGSAGASGLHPWGRPGLEVDEARPVVEGEEHDRGPLVAAREPSDVDVVGHR